LHALPAATLLIVLALTGWAAASQRPRGDDEKEARRRFVARLGTGSGVLCSVVALALWMPLWWLSPCAA